MPVPRYKVFASSQHFYISSSSSPDVPTLQVDIHSGDADFIGTRPNSATYITLAHIVVGLSPDRRSLILGTRSSIVASSPQIERVDEFCVLDLKSPQSTEEASLRSRLLTSTLKTPHFYFSHQVDLTRPRLRGSEKPHSLYSEADKRYVWNYPHLQALFSKVAEDKSSSGISSLFYKVSLIHGAVFSFETPIRNKPLKWILISRRSNERVGTRFFARGIDAEGCVANHVETEQIIRMEGVFDSSFLQTRDSIPLYWHQTPDIRYMPQPWLCATKENQDHVSPAKMHFEETKHRYGGALTCINLVNQKKGEGRMEQAFAKLVKECGVEGVSYVAFDFHSECKKSKGGWAQLSKLILILRKDFEKYGYYLNASDKSTEEQNGVFRTNCMDCLDRTNVVQSLLATEHINSVLKKTSILKNEESILNFSTFQNLYKNAWADHANLISIQYSGTGALKTDFTRTGVRTKWGLLQDGWNSANRYVFNNFSDGFRTDALNYFVGHLPITSILAKAKKDEESNDIPIKKNLPLALKGFISVFILLLLVLAPEDNKPIVALMTLILTLMVWIFKLNGPAFVNYPTDYDLRASPPLQPKKFKSTG